MLRPAEWFRTMLCLSSRQYMKTRVTTPCVRASKMPSPSDTVGRFPRSSFLQILRVSEDSTSPDDEPYIELSTPHVNYAVGGDSRADVAQSWQRVTVVLAALTSAKCNACAYLLTSHPT